MPPQRTRDIHSRSLEVTTDAPHPPTLAIISPTPRAFTFPISPPHSSPYSSPSTSPFDPDLHPRSHALTTPPPPHPHTPPPPPYHAPAHARRKSTASTAPDAPDRRPKKGDDDYVKRPENAFILFRRKCCEDRHAPASPAPSTSPSAPSAAAPAKKQRQADLSKTISQQWKALAPAERLFWEALAKEKKKEHEAMYPHYVYRPQRSKDREARSKSRRPKGREGEAEGGTDSESLSFVLPFTAQQQQQQHPQHPHPHPQHPQHPQQVPQQLPRHHGRSASMPTPPAPYQSIHVPNVYMPSCPTSPSLLPMISRRASHPDHARFDFDFPAPAGAGAFAQPFEHLQSPDFFHALFDAPAPGPGPADRRALQPLSTHHLSPSFSPAAFSPAASAFSPASTSGSGSSHPGSPAAGPFTPTALLAASFAHLAPPSAASLSSLPSLSSSAPASSAFASPPPSSSSDLALTPPSAAAAGAYYPYAAAWDWPCGADAVLLGDDFDLGAIPDIELGAGAGAGLGGGKDGFGGEMWGEMGRREVGMGQRDVMGQEFGQQEFGQQEMGLEMEMGMGVGMGREEWGMMGMGMGMGGDMGMGQQEMHHGQQEMQQGQGQEMGFEMFGFEEMMAGHGF